MNTKLTHFLKYAYLFYFGGSLYVTIETFWRARSHWTMFVLVGLIFMWLDSMNERWGWDFGLIWQVLIGTVGGTIAEFVCGCIVNLWLKWDIWDYSNLPFNLLGQISLYFTLAWIPLVLIGIILGDLIRWRFFDEEKPRYKLL